MAITTDTLKGRISHADSFPDVMEKNSSEFVEISVSDYLNALCRKSGIRSAEAIRRAHIERTYGCQIFNGTRVPSRDKLLQIAVGMGLSLDDTQDLLKKSGKNPLYPRIKRDAAWPQKSAARLCRITGMNTKTRGAAVSSANM